MNTLITLSVIIMIILIYLIYSYFKSKKPQNNCNHNLVTIKTRNCEYSNEYLSTCDKCGYQKTHIFTGIN